MGLFIGETPCPSSQCPNGWLWLKPIEGGLEAYSFTNGAWVLEQTIGLSSHSHPTHGDINFTGTISADGEVGITGSKVLDGKRLTFKNGILVGYEVV